MAKSLKNMMGAGIGAGTATLINGTVADGLTATGSGQADALILTNDVNVVGTVPLGTGVRLLANPQPGDETLITNLGANTLAVYPAPGANIGGSAPNTAFSLPIGAAAEFIARNGSTNWVALASGGTPTPTPTPSASPLTLAVNMSIPNWYTYSTPFMDTAYSAPGATAGEFGGFTGSTTGNPIPDANRDANGNPKSLPGGEAGIGFSCQLPTTLAQRKLAWQSALGGANHGAATMTMSQGGTGVTVDLVNRTVTYTPTGTADGSAGSPPSFVFTPVSGTDYPVNFIDRPVTDSGAVLTPEFAALIPAACSANPVIRFMDWSTVNRNNSPRWLGQSSQPATSVAGQTISSITFVGTTATVTTSTAHGLLGIGTGSASASVTVTGATPATYNVADAYVKVISPTQFQYTMGGTPTGNATVVGSYAVGDFGFQFTNLHYPVTANEPGVQFGEPIYTSSNRNKNKADAEWHDGVMLESILSLCATLGASPYYPVAPNSDSTFLADVATVCATSIASTGKPFYQSLGNEPWNSGFKWSHQLTNEANLRGTLGDALTACRLIDTVGVTLSGAQTVDGMAAVTGDRIIRAVGNSALNGVYIANTSGAWSRAADTIVFRSIWLVTSGLTNAQTSWFVSTQGAITLGTTSLAIAQIGAQHRYAEMLITAANAFRTAFASAGVSTKLNIVAEWQNYGGTAVWDDMAAFLGATAWAKVTHISVAPYYGDNSQMGIAAGFTGPEATLKAAVSADIDATIGHTVGHVTKAVALGKKLITYEGGQTIVLSDITYKTAWVRGTNSTSSYDLELRFLQQMELRAAPLQTGGLIHCQYNFVYPLAGSSFAWGLKEGLTSAAATPKLQAHTDFLAGTRVLTDATGTIGPGAATAPNGTSLGFLLPSAYGVTWSLTGNDGGRVAINAATGEVTVAASLSPGGSRSFTARQTLGVQTKDTTVSYSVISTVWNDSAGTPASNAAFALSAGNTVATRSSGSTDADVFGSNGHTTGIQSFIVTPNRSSGIYFVGLANASESNTNFIGATANSVGIFSSDGNIYKSGGIVLSSGATLGNTTPIKVILDTGLVYFQVDNGSGFVDVTGQNYGAHTGGITAPTGALYPAADAGAICAFTLDATNWP